MNDFKGFRADITKRLQQQEEKLTMYERKSLAPQRPQLSAANEAEAPHQKAFNAYLRSGDDDGLRGLELEGKSLNTAVAGDGGYLVDPQTAETIKSTLSSTASIRSIANVVSVEATSYDVLDRPYRCRPWLGDRDSDPATETGTPVD